MVDQPSSSVFKEEPTTQSIEEKPEGVDLSASKEKDPTPQQQPSAQSDNLWADQLASIQNERGEAKYKDLPTALDALKHSQEYIPSLKQENETLKEKVERLEKEAQERQALEDTLSRLTEPKQEPTAQPGPSGLTEEQVASLLEQRLTAREEQQRSQANLAQVSDAIRRQYGDKAKDVIAQKCEEYGMTPSDMESFAAKNPKAVSALFNVNSSPSGKPSTSSVNIPPVTPRQEHVLEKPSRSMLSGATTKDTTDYMSKVKESVYAKLGVQE